MEDSENGIRNGLPTQTGNVFMSSTKVNLFVVEIASSTKVYGWALARTPVPCLELEPNFNYR
jgi:hypothetical protein